MLRSVCLTRFPVCSLPFTVLEKERTCNCSLHSCGGATGQRMGASRTYSNLLLRGHPGIYVPTQPQFLGVAVTASVTQHSSLSSCPRVCKHDQQSISLLLFDAFDTDGDDIVNLTDIQVGLDLLFLRMPSSYYALAPILTSMVRGGTVEQGVPSVPKDSWLQVFATALEQNDSTSSHADLLTHLESALKAVSQRQTRILALEQAIVSRTLRKLDPPHSEEFPKQRIQGMSASARKRAKLTVLESCPPGYTFVNILGGGAFAQVFLVQHNEVGDFRAMKRIDREHMKKVFGLSPERVERMIELEFQHMDSIHHPHVVRLNELHQDSRYSYFIMESANGGSLQELVDKVYRSKHAVKGLTERYVANVLQQILRAIQSLHRDRRIHKDIKLENLMLLSPDNQPHVLLIDLGLVEMMAQVDDSRGPVPAGTIDTMAPEVIDTFLGRRPSGFDERCDIYSIGVVAFQLLTGILPYKIVTQGGVKAPIDYEATRANMDTMDVRSLLIESGKSVELADLVAQMLSVDPERRPSALECLSHEWSIRHRESRRFRFLRNAGKLSFTAAGLKPSTSADIVLAGEQVLQVKRKAIAQALLNFSQKSLAQRKVVYHLASYMPLNRLRRVTESYHRILYVDESLEGVLSQDAVAEVLMCDLSVDESTAKQAAAALDVDDSGVIDFKQFSAACCSLSEENARKHVGWLVDRARDENLSLEDVGKLTVEAAAHPLHGQSIATWLQESFEHLLSLETDSCADEIKQ